MSEKESKDDKPKEFEQQVLQRVEAKYHDELQNLMETCFNKLDMKEKGKEKKVFKIFFKKFVKLREHELWFVGFLSFFP